MEGKRELTPAEIPYLLLGFSVSLFSDVRDVLRLGTAVFDLMTGFAAVYTQIVLTTAVLLFLSQRLFVLTGMDVDRPRPRRQRGS